MPVFLDSNDETFEDDFRHLLSMKREDSPDVDRAVAEIIEDVRTRGDAAVVDLTKRFDRFDITSDTLRISDAEIKEHISKVSHRERQALELAAGRIRSYHEKQLPEDRRWREPNGAELGWRWTPVSAAGLYVPGGIASYPSSVLMNAIPANVAGVGRLVIQCPRLTE